MPSCRELIGVLSLCIQACMQESRASQQARLVACWVIMPCHLHGLLIRASTNTTVDGMRPADFRRCDACTPHPELLVQQPAIPLAYRPSWWYPVRFPTASTTPFSARPVSEQIFNEGGLGKLL
jgi:hypothetical protein